MKEKGIKNLGLWQKQIPGIIIIYKYFVLAERDQESSYCLQ